MVTKPHIGAVNLPKKPEKKLPDTPDLTPMPTETAPEPANEPEVSEMTDPPRQETEDQAELFAAEPEAPAAEPEAVTTPPKRGGRPTKEASEQEKTVFEEIRERWKPSTKGYVYRTQPYTNKLMGGTKHVHVRRYDEPFDADDLMTYAGSGAYMIMLTERLPDGKDKRTFTGDIKLLDYNRPPKLPPGEWIDDPRNKEWEWAKESIFPKKEEPAPKNDPLIEILRDELKAAREESRLARADANKKDPGEQSILAALLNRVMQPPPPPPPPPDPMANIAAIIQIAKALQPPPLPPAAPSPFEEIAKKMVEAKLSGNDKGDFEKFLEFKAKFDEAAPVERRGKKDTWDHITETIDALGPVLGPALQPLGQALAMSMMGRPPQIQQQPHQQPPPYTPAAMPPPAQPTQQPSATGPQAVQDRPSVPVFARAVLEGLKNSDKFTGLDLGDWYLKRWGAKEFADIQRQGKHEVIDLLKTGPTESWEPLKPYAEDGSLEELIEEFLEWEPDEPEQQQAKPQQPTAPPTEPTKPNWNNPAPVGVEVNQ